MRVRTVVVAAALAVTGLSGVGVGPARADFTATFCNATTAGAPWGGPPPGQTPFAAVIDRCVSGGGYEFDAPSTDLTTGTRVGATLTMPPGEVITGLNAGYDSADTTSGDAFLEIGDGNADLVHSEIGNDNAGTSVDAPVGDATSLFVSVYCVSTTDCEFATHNVVSLEQMTLTVHDTGAPSVSAQGGTLLSRGVQRGEQTLGYVASDTGSGVAKVTVSLGTTVVATQAGNCQAGALAPCAAQSSGVLGIDTALVPDGTYPVVITAYDYSGDPASVDAGSVTVRNHAGTVTLTPALRRLHVEVKLGWTWTATRTTLAQFDVRRLRGGERITVTCTGPHRPFHRRTAGPRQLRRFIRRLRGTRFAAGDRLRIVLTAPHRRPEHATLLIRADEIPKLLR